jgi:Cu/Zn superoxide dismutase
MTLNQHAKKGAALLAALAATGVLAACGGSGSDSGSSDRDAVNGKFEPVAGAAAVYAGVAGTATLNRSEGATEASISLTGLQPGTGYEAHLHTGSCAEADPGGPHFKFDSAGAEEPPNEIHFSFSSNEAGEGGAKASSDREVPVGEAGSIVVHAPGKAGVMGTSGSADAGRAVLVHEGEHHGDAHERSDKVACADLEAGSDGSAPEATIVVMNGEPVGGVQELEYNAGEEIAFRVESDVADEIHVHGYDLMEDVEAGGSVEFAFPAEIEGIFEVELEGRKEQIAEIQVNP